MNVLQEDNRTDKDAVLHSKIECSIDTLRHRMCSDNIDISQLSFLHLKLLQHIAPIYGQAHTIYPKSSLSYVYPMIHFVCRYYFLIDFAANCNTCIELGHQWV